MKRLVVLVLLFHPCLIPSNAQVEISPKTILFQGFAEKISGTDFYYNSTIPGINQSLLVRALEGKQSMVWTTETVPQDFRKKEAVFVWLAGIGSNLGNVKMVMEIDGQEKLSFYTARKEQWEVRSTGGIRLSFVNKTIDGAGDLFGFMFLHVPGKFLTPGKPLSIRVTGSPSNSRAWYMIFTTPLQSGISVNSYPAILKEVSGRTQVLGVNVYYFGPSDRGKLMINGKLERTVDLRFGYQFFRVAIPAVDKPRELTFQIESRYLNTEKKVSVQPPRLWRINFVQHTHTDIGYTRPQTEILAEHLRFIDYALEYCDQTDDYPDAAKFRWTCEASWPVDEYLKCRPRQQINRLKKRINEGRIEITGMYFNFDELPDEQTLAASLRPLKRFREAGIPVTTAMQNDVNGIGWCFSDFFPETGVKYLNMGTNGHRALICFDKPTAFWWESPSGSRMLAFRAEHYMTGNMFGIHSGDFNRFEGQLLDYLTELEKKGYPYDIIHIQYSGYQTDNSPPSTISSDLIRKWNEIYEWPKLKTAITREFFEEIDDRYADQLPVYRGAWPDWWTDGFGSGARELATTRQAHVDLIANTGGMTMAALMGARVPDGFSRRVNDVNTALLFYDEHTFGSSESVSEPYGESTMVQRRLKESYAWEAFKKARIIGEEVMGQLQNKVTKTDVPILAVYNTLNWKRSGLITTYIDHQILPKDQEFRIIDENGHKTPAQAFSHRSDGTYWGIWVDNVPAFGYKNYRIELQEGYVNPLEVNQTEAPVLENEWYRIQADPEKGAITSLFDKRLQVELADPKAEWKMGAFIYEQLGNRGQMEAFTLTDYERSPLDTVYMDALIQGPVYDAVHFTGEIGDCCWEPQGFTAEIRLYHSQPLIGMQYTLLKKPVTDPEGVYIAFPFLLEDGKIFCDVQGGVIEAGVDQIPGSSNDWNTIQNFVSVRNDRMQIILGSHEAPLMQLGGINTGRYEAGAKPESTHIYGWPMNNYWTTNFNAYQQGSFTWTYFLTTLENNGLDHATKTGWENRIPFLSRVLPAGKKKNPLSSGSVLDFSADNILLVNAKPIDNGSALILHLREIGGNATDLAIQHTREGVTLPLQVVDVTGRVLASPVSTVHFKPMEIKFIRIDLE